MGLEVVGDGLSTASVLAGGGYWWMAACQWARAIGDVGNSFRELVEAAGGRSGSLVWRVEVTGMAAAE